MAQLKDLIVNGPSQLIGTATVSADPTTNLGIATKQYVDNAFAVNDAMIFKGTIGTGGTITALPATHNRGWTYKVITAGTYANKVCEIGDLIICITDGTAANNDHWIVVQSNIDGAVIGPSSSVDNNIVVFNSTTGKVIKDSGIGVNTSTGTITAALSGNASTATTLETSRTIQTDLASTTAASFNGSANITPGITGILGIANGGTGNADGYIRTGQKSGTTIGTKATIEGLDNEASGNYSHAEGSNTIASGSHSHTEGYKTIASNYYSHAEGARHFDGREYSGTFTLTGAQNATTYTYIKPTNQPLEIGDYITDGADYSNIAQVIEVTSTTVTVNTTLNPTEAFSAHNFYISRGSGGALGIFSHTEGAHTTASGNCSHAEGSVTLASGAASHVEGSGSIASGIMSHAEGKYTKASGNLSHTEGQKTIASGQCSHAEGANGEASGNISHVEGLNTVASGQGSHAEGNASLASANYSHAEGASLASGISSHSESQGIASGTSAHAEGVISSFATWNIFSVGETTTTYKRVTGTLTDSHLGKYLTLNSNYTNFSPNNSEVSKIINVNLESQTFTVDRTLGILDNTTNGTEVYLFQFPEASNTGAHVEGAGTAASGLNAHAEGFGTIARGSYSHAEGSQTKANGNFGSHAEGANSTASGQSSHAEGVNTIASHLAQHVFGMYNIEDSSTATANTRGNYVEIVGNGNRTAGVLTQSNARTLDWDGNEVLAGKLTVGSAPTENMDVTTKQYVDSGLAAKGNAKIFKGICPTAAGTAAKIINCSEFTSADLVKGTVLVVAFDYLNTSTSYGSLTLNVNSTGAKNIKKMYNGAINNLNYAGELVLTSIFTYNGTYWILLGADYNTNSNTLQRTYASSNNIELPLTAYNSTASATAAAAMPSSGSYKDVYASIPNDSAKRATYNPSTGKITVPGGINAVTSKATAANLTTTQNAIAKYSDTAGTFANSGVTIDNNNNIFTNGNVIANELKGYVTVGQLSQIPIGNWATAEGQGTIASGDCSHAEGHATIASGNYSHVEGQYTTASGDYSHVEGLYNITTGEGSSVSGRGSLVKGDYSFVHGISNSSTITNSNDLTLIASNVVPFKCVAYSPSSGTTSSYWTFANGISGDQYLGCYFEQVNNPSNNGVFVSWGTIWTAANTSIPVPKFTRPFIEGTASGTGSGLTYQSYSFNIYSLPTDETNFIQKNNTIAFGKGLVALQSTNVSNIYKNLFLLGQYNQKNSDYIEIIGNGTSNSARSDARRLDQDGNEELAGNLLPMVNNSKNLGSSTKKWNKGYFDEILTANVTPLTSTYSSLGSIDNNWDYLWVNYIGYSNNDDENLTCPGISFSNSGSPSSIVMGFGQDTQSLIFEEGTITNVNVSEQSTVGTLLQLQPDIDSYSGTSGDGKTGVKILGSKGLVFTNNDTYGITSGSACSKYSSTDSDLDDTYITIYGTNDLRSSLQMNSAQIIARRKGYGFRSKTNAVDIELMIGSGGENRGIYDWTGNRWMIHSEGTTSANTKVYLGNSTTANDYAEPRNTLKELEPGRCVVETGYEDLIYSTERLQRGCQIVSDTYGFLIGGKFTEDEETKYIETPIAVAGRVLAYPYESIEEFKNHIGWPVCSGPNGTVSIMTEEEEIKYPSRIVGTISQIPEVKTYKQNGEETIKVNGRVWIKVK